MKEEGRGIENILVSHGGKAEEDRQVNVIVLNQVGT